MHLLFLLTAHKAIYDASDNFFKKAFSLKFHKFHSTLQKLFCLKTVIGKIFVRFPQIVLYQVLDFKCQKNEMRIDLILIRLRYMAKKENYVLSTLMNKIS